MKELKQSKTAKCWGWDVSNRVFTSPFAPYGIKYNKVILSLPKWHSDMTGQEIYNLLEQIGANPYWVLVLKQKGGC